MHIVLITPAKLGKQTGNSITAIRWMKLLKALGHRVELSHAYNGSNADIMIALNAYRSRESILKFKKECPNKPLIVVLTGTDLYRFLETERTETLQAIHAADRLVILSAMGMNALPVDQRSKTYLIYEAADKLTQKRKPTKRFFDVCVVGHLRPEKDPMVTALAVRNLDANSKIRVRHYGKAHTEEWAEIARQEMKVNPRYHWFGEVPHWKVRKALSKCNLFVLSSVMEGGPNSLSEAIVAEVPALTTNIDGCVGVLGEDYPGYYNVGDTRTLTKLLLRAESDSDYLTELEAYVKNITPRFTHEEEQQRWRGLLNELVQNHR